MMYWSYILTAVGVTGFILAGRKVWWCWYVNLACQSLWVTYALMSHQYGFIVGAVVYSFVFWGNAFQWTKDHRSEKRRIDALIADPFKNFDFNEMAVSPYVDLGPHPEIGFGWPVRHSIFGPDQHVSKHPDEEED